MQGINFMKLFFKQNLPISETSIHNFIDELFKFNNKLFTFSKNFFIQ